jgi:anti-sigma regulatory factor (Ser/Thr protein kinase)
VCGGWRVGQPDAVADENCTPTATSSADDPALRVEVPVDLEAGDGVRTQVVELAAGWGFTELEDLEVVTSELVTNAIVHAQSASTVEVRLTGECVEVAVTDTDPDPPVKRIPYEQHTRGLGLHIVDALADSWGVRDGPGGGKVVWARLGPFEPTT